MGSAAQAFQWTRSLDRRYRRSVRQALGSAKRGIHGVWSRWRLSRPYPIQSSGESTGQYGERLAAIYLERCGYRILERSFRTRLGEIDLIAAWGDRCIVFVEVKTWGEVWENAGGPSDAVDEEKQRKITQTALVYCKRHGLLDTSGRADVIEVTFDEFSRRPTFRHIENAFEAVGSYQLYS
ncbi:MAG: YraN family protein [Planctomycetota bacterium]|jgi:putative endonuclease